MPGRHRARTSLVLATLAVACTSPQQHAHRIDRSIRTQLEAQALPQAPRSTLAPLPETVRVRLLDGAVAVDDLALWTRLSPQQHQALLAERPLGWTHVPPTPLEPEGPDGQLLSATALAAMARAREGAQAVAALQSSTETGYVFFGDGDASFREVVRVLYTAGRAELGTMRLAARRADGSIGTLVPHIPRICTEADGPRPHPHSRGEACAELSLAVVEDVLVVRSKSSHQPLSDCYWATKAPSPEVMERHVKLLERTAEPVLDGDDDVWRTLVGEDVSLESPSEPEPAEESVISPAREVPSPPPVRTLEPIEPCREIPMALAADDEQALARVTGQLAGLLPYCTQASVTADDDVAWQDVVTAFDLVQSLGATRVGLEALGPQRCAAP